MAQVRLLVLIAVAVIGGCGTLPDGRPWGADVTLQPGWTKVRRAAAAAAADPGTWAPAAGAGVLWATGTDEQISDWAIEHKPIFGDDATEATDRLRTAASGLVYGTAVLTPSGPEPGPWVRNKVRGVGIEAFAGVVAINVTGLLKRAVRRPEPIGEPKYESFTSAHATLPFTDAALVRRNTAQLPWPAWGRRAVDTAALICASGAAWGRVEMGLHYPSDQLAGAAIGNFLGLFIHDLFMGAEDSTLSLRIEPGGGQVIWRARY